MRDAYARAGVNAMLYIEDILIVMARLTLPLRYEVRLSCLQLGSSYEVVMFTCVVSKNVLKKGDYGHVLATLFKRAKVVAAKVHVRTTRSSVRQQNTLGKNGV